MSTHTIVIKTQKGFEQILAQELESLGAQDIDILKRAVQCTGDTELVYKCNLYLRTALKVLVPIASFKARNEHELYKQIQEIDWSQHLGVDNTFAVESVVHSEIFTHSHYIALKTKDAIADQFRELHQGRRPSVDVENPDLKIHVHIDHNVCTLSLDSSGESLHRRGYRVDQMAAPLNEITAAAMILQTGWHGQTPFLDPMCGSGTLAIEAALMARRIAPGLIRKRFAFMKWKNFDRNLWQVLIEQAEANVLAQCPHPIYCYDAVFKATEVARANAAGATVVKDIQFSNIRFEEHKAATSPYTIVINPPYGERIQIEEINALYKLIGDTLKQKYQGSSAWILSSNVEALKHVGLKPSQKSILYNGPLECKYYRYDLYAGSRKKDAPVAE